ncbi:MAG: MraY family glycosyltransferase [Candidatus Nanoarchaeia archaeon]
MYGTVIFTAIIIISTFFASHILTKGWIFAAKKFGLVGKDMNKAKSVSCAEAGGIAVLFSTIFGIFFYVFFKTFIWRSATHFVEVLAIACTLLLAGFLGFIDDILGWKKGLAQWQKPLFTIPIAIPLAVLNASQTNLTIPFFGNVDFGLYFPLILVPVAIVGASNGFNMLAGLNGLEAGMGAIILGTLTIILLKSAPWLALLTCLCTASLLAFLLFNWYPAKVFPGNCLTYTIGALIGAVAILSDATTSAIILFLPYFAEFVLKAKSKFKGESFGVPLQDGTLKPPEKISSLTHIFMRFAKTEKRTVQAILGMELMLAVFVLFLYY